MWQSSATAAFPDRDAIVAFIRAHPGKVGTREIAREFGLKNADRVELKRILRELADEGAIAKRGKKIHEPAALPPTVMADITGRDRDGELIAAPDRMGRGGKRRAAENPHSHPAPTAARHRGRRRRPRAAAHRKDRATTRPPPISGRVIKVIDHATHARARHLPRPARRRRAARAGRQEAGRPRTRTSPRPTAAAREDGDLVSVELVRSRGFGLASGKVKERLGSLATEKAVSLIAIHAHDIPQVFLAGGVARSRSRKAGDAAGREDWRELPLVTIDPPDAKDHDDAVHAEPDAIRTTRAA